jgi:hypothetical protein
VYLCTNATQEEGDAMSNKKNTSTHSSTPIAFQMKEVGIISEEELLLAEAEAAMNELFNSDR